MILKNEIPILEYDTDAHGIIEPFHENVRLSGLPAKAVFAFAGDATYTYARSHGAETVCSLASVTRDFPIFVLDNEGEPAVLCPAPCGASAAVSLLDFLYAHGVETVLAMGSCGVLAQIPENAFLLPERALRDEGTSYHYLPPSRYVNLTEETVSRLAAAMERRGLPYQRCAVWTTDGFYRETRELTAYRREEGCACVDMECSALAACAEFRKKNFAQLLFTADSLANAEQYDRRSLGVQPMEQAVALAMQLLREL